MIELQQVFLSKAEESLQGAESEFTNHRYNNCVTEQTTESRRYRKPKQCALYAAPAPSSIRSEEEPGPDEHGAGTSN
jgi:hypothetical protein